MDTRVDESESKESEEMKAETSNTVDSEESGRTKPPYPKQTFFIFFTEVRRYFSSSNFALILCQVFERFSYYGTMGILNKYFKDILGYSESEATTIVHGFTGFGFLMGIFGSILADQWLGKISTILYLSIVYVIGHGLNTLGAFSSIDSLPHT